MTLRTSFFHTRRASVVAGAAVAALALSGLYGQAQLTATPGAPDAQNQPAVTGNTTTTTSAQGEKQQSTTLSVNTSRKKKTKVAKQDQVKQTKDTKAEIRKQNKYNPLIGKDATLPDKALYDKALDQAKRGHFDVARLELQALLSTYPDSQYQMRAKLAVADTWYREGGSAALAQAEQEYTDFITFFPNAPEASEAQMRIGDIYLKQMDVPDRDYSKALKAQEAYRTMLRQYPDAPKAVNLEAKQKLREVQEVLAQREAELGLFYASRENWPATIARYQTVADTYPQYSHMDDVLIGIGDAYEAEARAVRAQNLPEGPKAKLEQDYDGKAAEYYRKVVMEHAAAPHVEDAKERLASMNLPVPTPTLEQVQASELLEGSRAQYNLRRRLELLVLRRPDTVAAAQVGDPPLEDRPVTTAPTIMNQLLADYTGAFNPNAKPASTTNTAVKAATATDTAAAPTTVTPPVSSTPLAFQDVPAVGSGGSDASVGTVNAAPVTGAAPAASIGVEVLTPGINRGSGSASDVPAATGAPDPNYGLPSGGNRIVAAPPIEKPAEAPDQVNGAAGKAQPPAEAKNPNQKKNPKPAFDKDDESSSKHKPKKGINKINPF